jgi:hypothetical protein
MLHAVEQQGQEADELMMVNCTLQTQALRSVFSPDRPLGATYYVSI